MTTPRRTAAEWAIAIVVALLAGPWLAVPGFAAPQPQTAANLPYAALTETEPGVNLATGESFLAPPAFLHLGGPMAVTFQLYYAALLQSDGLIAGRTGDNWLTNYDLSLTVSGGTARFVDDGGRLVQFQQNGAGWTLVAPLDTPYQLAQNGAAYTVADPRRQWLYVFASGAGPLAQIQDGHGNALTLTYAGGLLSQVSDGLGRTLSFSYDATPHLTAVSDGTRQVVLGYTGTELTSVRDAAGQTTSFSYLPAPPSGLLLAMTLPRGNTPWTFGYDASARVSTATDAFGHATSFVYAGATTSVTDPASGVRQYTHDAAHALSVFKDETGAGVTYAYDAAGRPVSVTDRLGHLMQATYHAPSGYPSVVTYPDHRTLTLGFKARVTPAGPVLYDMTDITFPDGSTAHSVPDAAGNRAQWTDPVGNAWSATYNTHGQVLTTTSPLGAVTTLSYNPDATAASVTDAAGNTIAFGYDALRRRTQRVWTSGAGQSATYDARDRIVGTTDENGNATHYDYDANGLLGTITRPLGDTRSYGYDALDRVVTETDGLGAHATWTYDARGLLIQATDRLGNATSFTYDPRGWLGAVQDPSHQSWSVTRNAEGWPLSVTDPLGHTRSWAYDARGRTVQATDALGAIEQRAYDAMDRLVAITRPLGASATRERDPRGAITRDTRSGLATTTFDLNALSQDLAIVDPDGGTWGRTYDHQGRLLAATDPLGHAWSYVYDGRNRPTQASLPGGSATIGWDEAANLPKSVQYDDGTALDYTYDANHRLAGATGWTADYDANDAMTASNGLAITRDAGGRIATLAVAPGKTLTYTYDARGLLASVQDWVGGATTFGYDAAGRRISETRPGGATTALAYDAAGREVSRVDTRAPGDTLIALTLERDFDGRVVHAARSGTLDPPHRDTTRTWSFDAAAEVGSPGWVYDALGRVTQDGAHSYQWDRATRLTAYYETSAPTLWSYDATGLPVSCQPAGAPPQGWVWNFATDRPTLAKVTLSGAGDQRYFVYTPDGNLLYSIEAASGERRYYHFDECGNTLALTGDGGAVLTQYAYTPQGELAASGDSLGNPFTYGGESGVMREGGAGLYRVGRRMYDAASGRYLSRDPAQIVAGARALLPDPPQADDHATAMARVLVGGHAAAPEAAIGALLAEIDLGRHVSHGGYRGTGECVAGTNPYVDGDPDPLASLAPSPAPPLPATHYAMDDLAIPEAALVLAHRDPTRGPVVQRGLAAPHENHPWGTDPSAMRAGSGTNVGIGLPGGEPECDMDDDYSMSHGDEPGTLNGPITMHPRGTVFLPPISMPIPLPDD